MGGGSEPSTSKTTEGKNLQERYKTTKEKLFAMGLLKTKNQVRPLSQLQRRLLEGLTSSLEEDRTNRLVEVKWEES